MTNLLQKARELSRRCGPAARFVLKTIAGCVVPGGSAAVQVVENFIDCAGETVENNVEASASAADRARVEGILDLLLGDMADLVDRVRTMEDMPGQARELVRRSVATEQHCFQAAAKLAQLTSQMEVVETGLGKLAIGQEEMLGLQRRAFRGIVDYLAEIREKVDPEKVNLRLARMEDALAELGRNRISEATVAYQGLSREHPDSVAIAVGLSAAEWADHQFLPATDNLSRASRLRPEDQQLNDLVRKATEITGGTDPSEILPVEGPKVGIKLNGWLLERLLGTGGWGQVFLAEKGGQRCALKVLHPQLSREPRFETQFKREIALLVGLNQHPNLIRIDADHLFDRDPALGCWYYLMEFVEGTSLERHLARERALPWEKALPLFLGLAKGLATAHQRGIVHRDIKPANILLRTDPSWDRGVLTDFGLGGMVDPRARSLGFTALFAAPEQMRTGETSTRSDVFSLAATLYFTLLFDQADKRDRFHPRHLRGRVPEEVRAFLERCLDNDPGERPVDGGEFHAVLETMGQPESPSIREEQKSGAKVFAILPDQPETKEPEGKPEKVNTLRMRFVWIPPGAFLMGSPEDEPEREEEEVRHRVTLTRGFFLGVCPVTEAQWRKLLGEIPGIQRGKMHPVHANWVEAKKFCQALTEKEGVVYRLPTEAEWEYACRAGTSTPYFFGDDPSALGDFAWFWGNSMENTHPVCEKSPNPWGLHDLIGNVWEWCSDWSASFTEEDATDPKGPKGGVDGVRVVRGGAYLSQEQECRSASRTGCPFRRRDGDLGFRVVMEVSE